MSGFLLSELKNVWFLILKRGSSIFEKLEVKQNIFIFVSGAYLPLTAEGNIIANGVLVSCYAGIDHDLVHLTMIPMLMVSRINGLDI